MVTLKGYTANMLGLSTDQKPTDAEVNTIFRELNTNTYYYFDGTTWNEIPSSGGGGGTGTDNYNELSNKPQINGETLFGNKTAANLGLQPAITGDVKISSDNVDDTGATNLFVTSTEKNTWSGKQDALTFDDAPTESSNNPVKSGGIYTALSGKQAAITSDSKLNPALIDYNSTYAAVSNSEKTTYAGKQDALTFDGTYSSSTNKAATVSTVTNAIDALDVTGASGIDASKTISAWSETDGKVSISTQDIAITGSQAVLTGYAKTTGDVAATDTVTAAIGKLETKADTNENNISLTATSLQNQMNIVAASVGSGTADTEIAQARVGNDGEIYTSLNSRITLENSIFYNQLGLDKGVILASFAYGSVAISYNPTDTGIEKFKYILVDITQLVSDLKIYSDVEGFIPLVWVSFFNSSGTKLADSQGWDSNLANYTIRTSYTAYPTCKYVGLTFCYTTDGTTSTIQTSIPLSGITLKDNYAASIPNMRKAVEEMKTDIDNLKSFITVDKNGLGQYRTVSAAVAAAHDGDTIYINDGIYDEHINMNGKNINLVGRSKYSTFLVRSSKDYGDEPLAANIGTISDLTLIAGYGLTIDENDQTAKAYALHIEQEYATPYELTIDNCNIISYCAPAIGIGCRVNQTVNIKNCMLETTREHMYSTYHQQWYNYGALFAHNDATSATGTDGRVIVDNCELKGNTAALTLQSQNNGNTLTMRFTKNLLWSTTNGKTDAITIINNSTAAGHLAGDDIILDELSFGNNINDINMN